MLGKKIKAAILVEQKRPLKIVEIQLPTELEYGQVLVKIWYSGICGAQLNEIDGTKGEDKFLPHLLGHEGSGTVEEVGPGVTTVRCGDHVVLHWRKGDGIQSDTPKYRWGDQTINAGWVTTFNTYAVVSENRVTPITKDDDMRLAPLYGCALTTAFGVIHNDARLKTGESIAIFGVGGVGGAIVLMASLASANPVIAIDLNDFKLQQARTHGATHTIHSARANVKKEVLSTCTGGVDVAVDTTGIKSVRELAYEVTHPQGITVLVGVPRKGEKIEIDSFPLHFTKKITGSHGGGTNPSRDIPRLIRLQKTGKFRLDTLVTAEFSLDTINEAIEKIRTGDVLRCVINMTR